MKIEDMITLFLSDMRELTEEADKLHDEGRLMEAANKLADADDIGKNIELLLGMM